MAWISDAEIKDGKANKIHILGPVFLDDGYRTKVEIEMNRLQLSIPVKRAFMEVVEELPIIPLKRFYEYGIMLHYCLRKEKVGISDNMHYAEKLPETFREEDDEIHGTYEAEQQILKFVEDGNLAYKEKKNKLVTFGRLGKLSSGNYLQEIKQHVMIFIALCCRAAIRGGLASETAYQLSDMYIQRLEYCKTIDNVGEASQLAFGSPSYFTKIFCRKVGKTPAEYRL